MDGLIPGSLYDSKRGQVPFFTICIICTELVEVTVYVHILAWSPLKRASPSDTKSPLGYMHSYSQKKIKKVKWTGTSC